MSDVLISLITMKSPPHLLPLWPLLKTIVMAIREAVLYDKYCVEKTLTRLYSKENLSILIDVIFLYHSNNCTLNLRRISWEQKYQIYMLLYPRPLPYLGPTFLGFHCYLLILYHIGIEWPWHYGKNTYVHRLLGYGKIIRCFWNAMTWCSFLSHL